MFAGEVVRRGGEREDLGSLQVLLKDLRGRCSGCVVRVYLDHQLVEVLNYIFELFYKSVSRVQVGLLRLKIGRTLYHIVIRWC